MKIKCPHCEKILKSDDLCKHVRSITFADALGEKYISGILFEADPQEIAKEAYMVDVSKDGWSVKQSFANTPPLDVTAVTAVTNAMRKVNAS